jgi:cbb3-type cytochrome c oxidase subunit III
VLLVLACVACGDAPSRSQTARGGHAGQRGGEDAGDSFGNAAGHASDPSLTLIDDGGAGVLPDGAIVVLALWARPCPGGSTLSYENFGRGFFEQYCLHCHSLMRTGTDRGGAPQGVNFDTLDAIAARKDDIWHMAADTNMEMPASGPAPSAAERHKLGDWLACGAIAGDAAAP